MLEYNKPIRSNENQGIELLWSSIEFVSEKKKMESFTVNLDDKYKNVQQVFDIIK